MRDGFGFAIQARSGAARAGTLITPHGEVPTPAFMPVATYGAVRGVEAATLREIGARILLANTYHLHERPGEEVVANLGGLHGFSGWRGPWLTDSGGFQVTSLADRAVVSEEGVAFASPLDGARRHLTPERAVAIQEALGADIAMALDECRPPLPEMARVRAAMERGSLRWAGLAPPRPRSGAVRHRSGRRTRAGAARRASRTQLRRPRTAGQPRRGGCARAAGGAHDAGRGSPLPRWGQAPEDLVAGIARGSSC
jgi:hypothetical protein